MEPSGSIEILGARQHNLRGIDVAFAKGQLSVVTGVSGSGKSSLAFDTLFAEGQRRYVQSLSAYARQFLERMPRPDVDDVRGILPAIAIEQKSVVRTSRSTVATLSGLADYVQVLFARAATLHCGRCGRPVQSESPSATVQRLLTEAAERRVLVTFPLDADLDPERLAEARRQGVDRHVVDGVVQPVDESPGSGRLWLLVDRLHVRSEAAPRLGEALEQAFRFGDGRARLWLLGTGSPDPTAPAVLDVSSGLHCAACDLRYPEPVEQRFSFNSALGACPLCNGFGRIIDLDPQLIVPDPRSTLADGAIRPWTGPSAAWERNELEAFCARSGISLRTPWSELPDEARRQIFEGAAGFMGVRPWFKWLEGRTYKAHVRIFLARFRAYVPCHGCAATRFRRETQLFRLGGRSIAEVYALDVAAAGRFFATLSLDGNAARAAEPALAEVRARLAYLCKIGVGYLSLNRASRTLSGGETQRVNLTTAVGSGLVNTLFVLDEPSVGLHPRDTARLGDALAELAARGNTVVLVEHDAELIRRAHRVVDLGPGAGRNGGQLLYAGPPGELAASLQTPTAQVLRGELTVRTAPPAAPTMELAPLHLRGARGNNLCDVDLELPLGRWTCVTGVSGSGKTTLVKGTLVPALKRLRGEPCEAPYPYGALLGAEPIDEVVVLDQQPAGRTARANPVTYIGAYDVLRALYAADPVAQALGLEPGHFSFNVAGGRCEVCRGSGVEQVEMQFLADVTLPCPACGGRRFGETVRQVRCRGLTIDETLQLTVDEARERFADERKLRRRLDVLAEVGLGYLQLGQPLSTLSGGEQQRLRLADFFASKRRGHTLFVCDEPTTGLHGLDVATLVRSFRALVGRGDTLVVIEHHPDLILAADHIVDLGPEGGLEGGHVVASGPPDAVMAVAASHTGRALRAASGLAPLAAAAPQDVAEAAPPGPGVVSAVLAVDDGPAPSAPQPAPGTAPRPLPAIHVTGARVNNLANLSLAVPRGKFVVVTGPSGSGKSSLAFNLLFAEGQRRFLDCVSPYARQYVVQLGRPDVDALSELPPAIAIEQRTARGGAKATVATAVEIYHYLRLLYARIGLVHCARCDDLLSAMDAPRVAARLRELLAPAAVLLLAPVLRGRKGFQKDLFARLRKDGFREVRVDSQIVPLRALDALDRYRVHDIDVVIARLELGRASSGEVEAAVARALVLGRGTCLALPSDGPPRTFSLALYCPRCDVGYEPPDPILFSFNAERGACPVCTGSGSDPLTNPDEPTGVCPACSGKRLNRLALAVRLGGLDIAAATARTPGDLVAFLDALPLSEREQRIAAAARHEISERARWLRDVGLGYLQLDRSHRTLSGGEVQRVRLAAQLAAPLSGALYVMDEPTIGLHPVECERLLDAIQALVAAGNSVVVVEHDEQTIRRADHVIDLGPAGGAGGGRLIAQGPLETLLAHPESPTGRYLRRDGAARRGQPRPVTDVAWLHVRGACLHNLRNLDVSFPRGRFTVVTGRSGSGKSTLVREVLLSAARARLAGKPLDGHALADLHGLDGLAQVTEIDNLPIGRTPRSTPATYVKAFDEIRKLFGQLPESRLRGWNAARFSFNVEGGRCPQCSGQGLAKIEMSFLPDVFVQCEACAGQRFARETLVPRFKGHSIADVLRLTVSEALALFADLPSVRRPLQLLDDVGLGYLTLGQPSPTLSGGEAQRVKLVWQLAHGGSRPSLYVLDEPTVGLHGSDLQRLLAVLTHLVERGHTLIVIEHNLDVVAAADWLVDLGPGGGAEGGQLLYAGPPEPTAAACAQSSTLRCLRQHFEAGAA